MFRSTAKFVSLWILLFGLGATTNAQLKFTNIICESFDEKLLQISACQIKAIARNVNEVNLILNLHEPWETLVYNAQSFKKANGYKPWLYNITLDGCAYLRHPKNPVVNFFFGLIREYTNLNHTCPLKGELCIKHFRLEKKKFTLPMHEGNYMIQNIYIANGKPIVMIKVFVDINL